MMSELGNRTKLTDKTIADISDAISIGATKEIAARFAGVSVSGLMHWLKDAREEETRRENGKKSKKYDKHVELLHAIEEARADLAIGCLNEIKAARDKGYVEWSWKMLAAKYPKEYGQKTASSEVSSDETGDNDKPFTLSSLPADLLAPSFLAPYRDIRDRLHVEYLFKGGRGSGKSSFTSEAIIYLIINHPGVHALALRQVGETLRDSVYSQLIWAITVLGLEDKFKCITSPLEITYLPTGQKIYFRGADKPEKIKSIKPKFGHIGILWFEELDQFHGMEAVRKIEQSVLRGGEEAWNFKTYNPPKTAANWVNKYVQIPKANQLQHHSTYLDVPHEWLGQTFIDEAEHLKSVNPTAYDHEYLGIVTGTGGMVFDNVKIRKITKKEIEQFDHVGQGMDFGWFPDPLAWGKSHYDAARHILYIFDEYKANKKSNRAVYDDLVKLKSLSPGELVIADSAEPKSIADFLEYGANVRGAEKGPESVNYSMKWLQSLAAIVIDPERCPEHANEFLNYELEQDKDGNFISEYPDKNNHFIDAERYRTNLIWRRRGQ